MKTPAFAIASVLLSGCVPAPETRGQVVELTDRTVKIRGPFDMSLGSSFAGKGATPTPGIIAQAQEICPGATFLSALGDTGSPDTFDYLFQCK